MPHSLNYVPEHLQELTRALQGFFKFSRAGGSQPHLSDAMQATAQGSSRLQQEIFLHSFQGCRISMKSDFANTVQIIHTEHEMRSDGIQCDSRFREVMQSSLMYFQLESNSNSLRIKENYYFSFNLHVLFSNDY